jgi:DNA (cytosine-5)-methyltransferase 1
MLVLDLFSGIGGFSLGLQRAGMITVQFVEIDPFCQKVLNKNFPGVPIHDDIKTFYWPDSYTNRNGLQKQRAELETNRGRQYDEVIKNAGCQHGTGAEVKREFDRQVSCAEDASMLERPISNDGQRIDLICGGFPCQPFSCAGKRKGTEDDRFLWPEMLRVISEVQPAWVIAENVGGLYSQQDGMVFGQVLSDLEAQGYEVQPFLIPACAVNAPHRRDRFWIVAHAKINGSGRRSGKICQENGRQVGQVCIGVKDADCHVADTEYDGLFGTNGTRSQTESQVQTRQNRIREPQRRSGIQDCWTKNWLEVATSLCRVDDGVSRQMDRVNRLKALGNAVVPQIAEIIGRAIMEVENR